LNSEPQHTLAQVYETQILQTRKHIDVCIRCQYSTDMHPKSIKIMF